MMALVAVLTLPSCRRKPAGPPPSPWLVLKQAPLEEGAMGILAGPGRGQQEFSLVPPGATQGRAAPAVACVSLSAPILEGESSAYPAVFAQVQGRALVWGPSGWGWVELEAGRAQVTTLAGHLDAVLNSTRAAIRDRTNGEGWTLHNRWLLTLTPQGVRTEPRDEAPFAATPFPDGRLQGEGVWRATRPGEFAAGSQARPLPLLKLNVTFQARRVPTVVARPFERRGDWLQVGFPRPGTATYLADSHGVGESADNPGLLVQWADQPAGWIKLAKPGPVPGTALRQWSWWFLGSRD
jgi:hypothetical protein